MMGIKGGKVWHLRGTQQKSPRRSMSCLCNSERRPPFTKGAVMLHLTKGAGRIN